MPKPKSRRTNLPARVGHDLLQQIVASGRDTFGYRDVVPAAHASKFITIWDSLLACEFIERVHVGRFAWAYQLTAKGREAAASDGPLNITRRVKEWDSDQEERPNRKHEPRRLGTRKKPVTPCDTTPATPKPTPTTPTPAA